MSGGRWSIAAGVIAWFLLISSTSQATRRTAQRMNQTRSSLTVTVRNSRDSDSINEQVSLFTTSSSHKDNGDNDDGADSITSDNDNLDNLERRRIPQDGKCDSGFKPIKVGGGAHEQVEICVPCPKGHYGDTGKSCTLCLAGTYQSELGAATCKTCENGEISGVGEGHCVMCPSGKHASEKHQMCLTCPEGSWSNAGDTACSLCPPGTYNEKGGRPGCKDCGQGYFNPSEGASTPDDCLECPRGYHCPNTATATPVICPDGYFSPRRQAEECLKCPWMFYTTVPRTGCLPSAPFYVILIAAVGLLASLVMLLLQCPSYNWGGVAANAVKNNKQRMGGQNLLPVQPYPPHQNR